MGFTGYRVNGVQPKRPPVEDGEYLLLRKASMSLPRLARLMAIKGKPVCWLQTAARSRADHTCTDTGGVLVRDLGPGMCLRWEMRF